MSSLALSGLFKSFGGTPVLVGLDLEVPDGSVVAVLGESGSGKTTLLRLVAGYLRPDAGTVAVGGRTVDGGTAHVPTERRGVGYVPQEGALFPHLDAERNVAFGLTRAERRAGRARELLELVSMAGLERRYPHELSGGQQQRVALARALAPGPKAMLLDEPFSSLDAGLRASLRGELVRVLRSGGITTVLVTHDQQEALSVADLVAVMAHGRIHQLAQPEELYRRPVDAEVARFLGEANLVPGRCSGTRVSTELGEVRLRDSAPAGDGPVTVLVRPEQLRLCSGAGEPARRAGILSGKVVQREYYGHDCVLVVEAAGRDPLRVRSSGEGLPDVGAPVALTAEGAEAVAWPAPS